LTLHYDVNSDHAVSRRGQHHLRAHLAPRGRSSASRTTTLSADAGQTARLRRARYDARLRASALDRVDMTTGVRRELHGDFGMVASTHRLASLAGLRILERGGNAADAAVAAGLTLQVVEPHHNGLGGDLVALVHPGGGERPVVLCGQGVAPAAATVGHLHSMGVEAIPGSGLLPACVPGAFDAWMLLLRDHGSMGLEDVFESAIAHAERGVPIDAQLAAVLASMEPVFREHWPSSLTIYGGRRGASLVNSQLAATYRRLVKEGMAASGSREGRIDRVRDAFLRGFVAERISAFVDAGPIADVSGVPQRGLLVSDDLAGWSAGWEECVSGRWAGATVHKGGPWGQGPVLLQMVALLQRCAAEADEPFGGRSIHTVVECFKLALADRDAWYGDAPSHPVPLVTLLGDAYNDARARLIGEHSSDELRPGAPDGRLPARPDGATGGSAHAPGLGEPSMWRGDTCHLDVVDRWGNAVAATPSGGWLQSSPVVPDLGFALGTRGQMFSLEEGRPNMLAPGTRPRTTLSPTIVNTDDGRVIACGTPGGDMQDQWTLNFLRAHLLHGRDLCEAIDAVQFHTLHVPSSFAPHERTPRGVGVEDRLAPAALADLRRRGHVVSIEGPFTLGRVCAVSRDAHGSMRAAADSRGLGQAVGR
jgi:gamma-glutamyltranspeptidase/glutathione hydrolase